MAVAHRELNVHQADDLERLRQAFGLASNFGDDILGQGVGRQGTGRISGVNSGFLYVLHDARHENGFAVAHRVGVDLDRLAEVTVDQHRAGARGAHGVAHIALQVGDFVDDLHGPPA